MKTCLINESLLEDLAESGTVLNPDMAKWWPGAELWGMRLFVNTKVPENTLIFVDDALIREFNGRRWGRNGLGA